VRERRQQWEYIIFEQRLTSSSPIDLDPRRLQTPRCIFFIAECSFEEHSVLFGGLNANHTEYNTKLLKIRVSHDLPEAKDCVTKFKITQPHSFG
jgi:hypothetical protein